MPDNVNNSSGKGIPIPSSLVEFILLGPLDDRRQLQDSPILGDVWVEFAKRPSEAIDLLIAPFRGQHAGAVANAIDKDLGEENTTANLSYLQGLVAASLTFHDLLVVVVPKTKWWLDNLNVQSKPQQNPTKKRKHAWRDPDAARHKMSAYTLSGGKSDVFDAILKSAKEWQTKGSSTRNLQELTALDRFAFLAGLMLWAGAQIPPPGFPVGADEQISYILNHLQVEPLLKSVGELVEKMSTKPAEEPLVWQVSLNRRPVLALTKSIPAVKGDAAKTLFSVNCSGIGWAVVDSGIDATHPAFFTESTGELRVKRSFDFTRFRRIVSLSNLKDGPRKENVAALSNASLLQPPFDPDADLRLLAQDARSRGPVRWDIVERFVEIKPDAKPPANHGTHVAGIIGASKAAALKHAVQPNEDFADGMCPDISLFDFRVLGRTEMDTEFAVIAALQFIRYLNERDNLPTVHGANLSLSIPHDVRNFACGRTPICDECERLVESGVVVVAAAGNHGYKTFQTKDGSYDGYAAFSITDPGNADSVLTVGATHRFWPHTYGVSFFSSRGPTGDGRLKPDLVAPGERIRAPLPGGEWGDLDGTSMAAPHVSGAAAMLMARYSELMGHPRRVKQIICDSATDLGRERSFQGRGMLDVLRAFQSI